MFLFLLRTLILGIKKEWDSLYPYYSVYTDMLIDATDSFDLRLSISNIQVLTWYMLQTQILSVG